MSVHVQSEWVFTLRQNRCSSWAGICTRLEGLDAVVSVEDNGRGISPDMLSKVCGMFIQANSGVNRGQEGLGVGLALAQTIITQHEGRLEVKSDGLGQGSTFTIRLPVSSSVSDTQDQSDHQLTDIIAQRVLVVDDNRDITDSLALLLEMLVTNVQTVNDGPSALDALQTYQPSVVLLDIGMPDMDGYEVARRLRSQPAGRDVTLIALTGWGREADHRQTRAAGFDHHLVKPVNVEELEQLLASLVSNNETRIDN